MKLSRVLITTVVAALTAGAVAQGPAQASTPFAPCALTGFTPVGATAVDQGRADAAARRIEALTGGANVDGLREWSVPHESTPSLAVDADQAAADAASVDLVLFGFHVRRVAAARVAATRYSAENGLTSVGWLSSRVGLSVTAGRCRSDLVLASTRASYTNVFGAGGIVLIVVGLFAMVFLGRRRRGTWAIRFLVAAPAGLLAGIGEAMLLQETGAVSPFSIATWFVPVTGLALAAVMPLTRRAARNLAAGAPVPGDNGPAPTLDDQPPRRAETASTVDATEAPPVTAPTGASVQPEPSRLFRLLVNMVIAGALVLTSFGAALAAHPSVAQTTAEAVTPSGARLIFSSMWAEAKAARYDHLTGPARRFAVGILDNVAGFRKNEVTNVTVGVPAEQRSFPAYFVATADTAIDDGRTLHLFAVMSRESTSNAWTIVEFRVAPSLDFVPRPNIGADGYLAALPSLAELAMDPHAVGARYAQWYNRSAQAKAVVVDDILALRPGSSDGALAVAARDAGVTAGKFPAYRKNAAAPGASRADLVPLIGGGVLVSFSTTIRSEVFNNDRPVTRSCASEWLTLDDTDPGHYQHTRYDATAYPVAYVPLRSAKTKTIIQDNVNDPWKGTGDRC